MARFNSEGPFARLARSTTDSLFEAGVRRSISCDSYLFLEGDESASVHLVVSGLVKVTKAASEGRHIVIALRGPEQFIGELGVLGETRRSASVIAIADTDVLTWSRPQFIDLIERHPDLGLALLDFVSGRLRRLLDKLVEFGTTDAITRVAGQIVSFVADADLAAAHGSLRQSRTHEPIEIRLPHSQEELGASVGLARESVVRAMAKLRRDGIIATGRQRVKILDLGTLQQLSGVDLG